MRLSALELSVRETRTFQRTRSNFTRSSTDFASGRRPNATRDGVYYGVYYGAYYGAYSETVCSAYGSSAAPRPTPFFSILIVKTKLHDRAIFTPLVFVVTS
jgi:hypothetical protein